MIQWQCGTKIPFGERRDKGQHDQMHSDCLKKTWCRTSPPIACVLIRLRHLIHLSASRACTKPAAMEDRECRDAFYGISHLANIAQGQSIPSPSGLDIGRCRWPQHKQIQVRFCTHPHYDLVQMVQIITQSWRDATWPYWLPAELP